MGDVTKRVMEELKVLRVLEHPIRMKAYLAIRAEPRIPFGRIARKVGVESGLAAYHVGILKSAGLVDVNYARHSKETSEYTLTKKGEEVYQFLRRGFRASGSQKVGGPRRDVVTA